MVSEAIQLEDERKKSGITFCLLPLRLPLLPLNKNCFSNIVFFCVYIINIIIHGCLEIWDFSSRV